MLSRESDAAAVRRYLAAWGRNYSWASPDDEGYVSQVVDRMTDIRREHPDGKYPGAIHGIDDIGACPDCDAIHVLRAMKRDHDHAVLSPAQPPTQTQPRASEAPCRTSPD